MLLGFFGVMVLIPCVPVVGVLIFFSPGAPAVFLREGYAGYVSHCRILFMLKIISFLPSLRGQSSHSFMGTLKRILL
jgi:hypothetical protein